MIVNAGGVWSEQIAHLSAGATTSPVSIRPAKGIHVVVPADRLPCDFATVLAVPGDQRSIFVVPWAADEPPATTRSGPLHLHRHHRHRLRRPARRPAVHTRRHRVPLAGRQRLDHRRRSPQRT